MMERWGVFMGKAGVLGVWGGKKGGVLKDLP